jgi:hypothetical protein
MAITPEMAEMGSPPSRGWFSHSTTGTIPNGFGSGHGSSPTSRGVQSEAASETSAGSWNPGR